MSCPSLAIRVIRRGIYRGIDKNKLFVKVIDITIELSYNNSDDRQQVCLFKRGSIGAYRYALLYGAFQKGCAYEAQTGVGFKPKENAQNRLVKTRRFFTERRLLWTGYCNVQSHIKEC